MAHTGLEQITSRQWGGDAQATAGSKGGDGLLVRGEEERSHRPRESGDFPTATQLGSSPAETQAQGCLTLRLCGSPSAGQDFQGRDKSVTRKLETHRWPGVT